MIQNPTDSELKSILLVMFQEILEEVLYGESAIREERRTSNYQRSCGTPPTPIAPVVVEDRHITHKQRRPSFVE